MRNKIFLRILSVLAAAAVLMSFTSCRAVFKRDRDRAWEYLTDRYTDDVFEFKAHEGRNTYSFSSKRFPGEDVKVNIVHGTADEENYTHLRYAEQTETTVNGLLVELMGETPYFLKDESDEFTPGSLEILSSFDEYISSPASRLSFIVYAPLRMYTFEDFYGFQDDFLKLYEKYGIFDRLFEFRFVDDSTFEEVRSGKADENDITVLAIYSIKSHTSRQGMLDSGWIFRERSADPRRK